jgi:hypothetical protein
MSMIIDGTNGLTFNNATTQASAGQVLQVVTTELTTVSTTSSTSWTAATDFAVTISPKFSTSKIFILIAGGMGDVGATTPSQMAFTIYRGSTNLAPPTGGNDKGITEIYGASSRVQIPLALSIKDSPNTTSATTYSLYYRSASGQTVSVNNDNTRATITAMEIAA